MWITVSNKKSKSIDFLWNETLLALDTLRISIFSSTKPLSQKLCILKLTNLRGHGIDEPTFLWLNDCQKRDSSSIVNMICTEHREGITFDHDVQFSQKSEYKVSHSQERSHCQKKVICLDPTGNHNSHRQHLTPGYSVLLDSLVQWDKIRKLMCLRF